MYYYAQNQLVWWALSLVIKHIPKPPVGLRKLKVAFKESDGIGYFGRMLMDLGKIFENGVVWNLIPGSFCRFLFHE